MSWNKIKIITQSEEFENAQAPIIISASRSTDIPAFYSDWFFQRLKEGYVKWTNPFNGKPIYVSFQNTRLIVFWSKNHKPIIEHLNYLDDKQLNYYFQFTLNDYDAEKFEPRVPNVQTRIETFIKLSEKVGKEKVIWRFDPLILTDKMGVYELLRKVENVGNQLKNYTNKLVFSFADIKTYRSVQNNLRNNSIPYQEFNYQTMTKFAEALQRLNYNWNFEIATCAEEILLNNYGIAQNKCIDDDLIIKLFSQDKVLMDFLGVKVTPPDMFNSNNVVAKEKDNKDKGQRQFCGCIKSKDIGEYNTCPHLCKYCYANKIPQKKILENWELYKKNKNADTITNR